VDELLQQVAEQTGIPADMLERAAQARAEASGTSAEAIVAGWAGAPIPEAGAAPAAAAVTPAAASAAAAIVEAAPSLSVEVLEPVVPAEESEPAPEPELELIGPGLPRWLSAAFVIIPFIAILYALSVPNGPDCGNAGRLGIDVVTGEAVNCDGSEFGSEDVNIFALGQSVYDASCTACHGPTGGGGAGPALAGGAVVSTFSSCSDHIEWVTLGSAGWPDGTYGDNATTLAGGMPGFGAILESLDLTAAVLYERVAFGGEELAVAEASCGFGP
jgi:hypothetical protein